MCLLANYRTDAGSYYILTHTPPTHPSLGATDLSNHLVEQVIAPFLVTLRIANRRAFVINNSVSTDSGSVRFWNRGKRRSDTGSFPSGYTTSSMDTGEIAHGDVIMIGPHHSDGFSDSKESLKT